MKEKISCLNQGVWIMNFMDIRHLKSIHLEKIEVKLQVSFIGRFDFKIYNKNYL